MRSEVIGGAAIAVFASRNRPSSLNLNRSPPILYKSKTPNKKSLSSSGLGLRFSFLESNALDLELARDVSEKFRVNKNTREEIINKVIKAVSYWREIANGIGISRGEMQTMESAFSHF